MWTAIAAMALAAGGLMTSSEVNLVADGFQFSEGPVQLMDGLVIFSDIPADTIYDEKKVVFRHPSGQSNGLTLDGDGRLIAAEHKNRRVSRTEQDGSFTVLADKYEGKRLNSPNDVVVRSDGAVFFTDPPYGLEGGLEGPEAELDFCGVYSVSAAGELRLLVRDFKRPNGLAFSPDEKTLYIADTERGHIRAFDVAADTTLTNDRVFHTLPSPDGMKVDSRGGVWCTSSEGVCVIDRDGKRIDTIVFPEQPANCAFGGNDGQTFYVTARHGLYKVRSRVPGILPGPAHVDRIQARPNFDLENRRSRRRGAPPSAVR